MKLSEKMRKAWLLSARISGLLAPKRREMIFGSTHTTMQMRIMATVINENDLRSINGFFLIDSKT